MLIAHLFLFSSFSSSFFPSSFVASNSSSGFFPSAILTTSTLSLEIISVEVIIVFELVYLIKVVLAVFVIVDSLLSSSKKVVIVPKLVVILSTAFLFRLATKFSSLEFLITVFIAPSFDLFLMSFLVFVFALFSLELPTKLLVEF